MNHGDCETLDRTCPAWDGTILGGSTRPQTIRIRLVWSRSVPGSSGPALVLSTWTSVPLGMSAHEPRRLRNNRPDEHGMERDHPRRIHTLSYHTDPPSVVSVRAGVVRSSARPLHMDASVPLGMSAHEPRRSRNTRPDVHGMKRDHRRRIHTFPYHTYPPSVVSFRAVVVRSSARPLHVDERPFGYERA